MTEIREYRDGDEKGILSLFKKVFKEDREVDYWKWLYLKNPAANSIIALAEDESKIVVNVLSCLAKWILKESIF